MNREILYGQPMYLSDGTFVGFHCWGWFSKGNFVAPISAYQAHGEFGKQYTGLKDKNNKDIYEGDIVIGTFPWGGYQGVVEYSDGCFYVSEHGDASFLPFYDHQPTAHEVIGNIYENPELLEQEKK